MGPNYQDPNEGEGGSDVLFTPCACRGGGGSKMGRKKKKRRDMEKKKVFVGYTRCSRPDDFCSGEAALTQREGEEPEGKSCVTTSRWHGRWIYVPNKALILAPSARPCVHGNRPRESTPPFDSPSGQIHFIFPPCFYISSSSSIDCHRCTGCMYGSQPCVLHLQPWTGCGPQGSTR